MAKRSRSNKWQAFVKKHKGMGYSRKELSEMYKEEQDFLSKSWGELDGDERTRRRGMGGESQWHKFLKKHKSKGYNQRELADMYKAQKKNPSGEVMGGLFIAGLIGYAIAKNRC